MVARSSLILLSLLALPVPALAQQGTQVPEASSAMLFALGALGVIVGRQVSRRRKTRD